MERKVDLEEKDLRELQEVRSNLLQLTQHPGFIWMMGVIEGQIERRFYENLKPLASMDETLAQEFSKGEAQGLVTTRELVPTQIEYIESLIAAKETDHVQETSGNSAE